MSTTQYLIDASTRHQVFLQRYAGGQSKRAISTLMRLRRDINARLSREPTEFQRQRLEAVLFDVNELSRNAFTDIGTQVTYEAGRLAEGEAGFSAALYSKASTFDFALPSSAALLAAVESKPMTIRPGYVGVPISEALKQYGAKKSRQIEQIIRDGMVVGDTTPEISSRLATVMNTLQRRQLDTLVRTVANHASAVAREKVYEANADVLDGYKWVSTLDSSTTLVCASRDQKVYEIGIGPVPPAHWGCRSTTIPAVNPEYSLAKRRGERPSVGADGGELVGAGTSYGGWLKTQPVEFVDEALGVERSALFRAGKIKIEGFVDPTGRVYTLEQLRAMNPIAFAE